MTKRKATLEEAKKFIKEMIDKDELYFKEHVEIILKKVFPFSWNSHCDKKGIKTEIKK